MIRSASVALAGGLIVSLLAGGCSSQHTSSAPSTTNPPPALKLTVDGQDQNLKGPFTCQTTPDGFIKIAIGEGIGGTDITPYSATMTNTNPLDVRSVVLGQVNGEDLAFFKGFYNDTAQATVNGKSYKITGTASGGIGKKAKQFEMYVSCP